MKKPGADAQDASMMKLVALDEIHAAKDVAPPEEGASLLSRLTLTFLTPLLAKGSRIKLKDIGRPLAGDQAANVSKRFRRAWDPRARRSMAAGGEATPDLFAAQLRSLDGGVCKFCRAMLCYFCEACLQLVPALCLRSLVRHFEDNAFRMSTTAQWCLVAALYLAPSLGSLCRSYYDTSMVHFGTQMYSAVSLALYEKALRLSPTARGDYDAGRIVTLFSVDAFSVQRLLLFIGILFSGPVIIALCLYFIHQLVGRAMWIGLAFMIGCVPLQIAIFVPFLALQKKYLRCADDRVKLVNEVLGGVRVVKYLAWERPFLGKILDKRTVESSVLWRQSFIIGIGFAVVMLGAPIFQPVLIFNYYCGTMGRTLDASTAFATLSFFSLLRLPLAFLPFCLITYLSYRVSARRMAKFLVASELAERGAEKPPAAAATIEKGTFAWSVKAPTPEPKKRGRKKVLDEESPAEAPPPNLLDISLDVPKGALVGVVGPVGSGKSSLLSALAGEMEAVSGSVRAAWASAAYCAQVPWVLNATLVDNVTFGSEFDGARFAACVDRCALRDDLAQLPGGAQCEIGERGINLSGGQKARVSLARAAYAEADVALLDDPLSAVDAHVALHIFENCIAGDARTPGSLAGRTRVLVTHHASVLPRCDVIVVMKDGRVEATGTYDELSARGVDMGELVKPEEAEDEPVEAEAVVVESLGGPAEAVAVDARAAKAEGALVEAEAAQTGLVSNRTWLVFARAGGWGWIALAVLVLFAGRSSELAGQFYLVQWTSRWKDGKDPSNAEVNRFVLTYMYYALGAVAGLAIRGVVLAHHRIVAANSLHARVLERVLFAPTAFFDVTPVGRVLNRFSGDLLTVDTELSRTMSEFSGVVMYVIGAVGALCVATKGLYLVLVGPLIVAYRYIDRRFRYSSTQISRLAKLARSPVIADFTEVLNGVSTVRAYGAVETFEARLRERLDGLAACVVAEQLAYNWLSVRLDQLAAISGASVAAVAVATKGELLSPGLLGLALMACIEITGFLKNAVRLSTLLASHMAAVERLGEYGDFFRGDDGEPLVPAEAAEVVAREEPPADAWAPAAGALTFADASMRYRDGPLVLRGVSFAVEAGHRVGVVGRTGSGKSSLAAALFRVVELAGGTISIDGLDTRTLGLKELRRGLFIIPQDPVLCGVPRD